MWVQLPKFQKNVVILMKQITYLFDKTGFPETVGDSLRLDFIPRLTKNVERREKISLVLGAIVDGFDSLAKEITSVMDL